MSATETNQIITFVGVNRKSKMIIHRHFSLSILNPNHLKVSFTNSDKEDRNFIVRCIDAENLAEVIQISFFDNNESMTIKNIEIYEVGEEKLLGNIITTLVPMFKNIVDPHIVILKKEDFTLTLYSLDDTQYMININDIKTLNFNSDDIYITIITNNNLYRIIASNCKYIYSILEDSVVINPRDITIQGIIVISCTIEEFREDSFKYSLNAQVLD